LALPTHNQSIVPMVAPVLQGHSLTDPLRETVAHKTSRPDGLRGQGGNPEVFMGKPTKPARATARHSRQHNRDGLDDDEPGAFDRAVAALTEVFGEVETIDEIAPTMVALLRALPSGTRIYLRLKRTLH
jgi:hypothetical protein